MNWEIGWSRARCDCRCRANSDWTVRNSKQGPKNGESWALTDACSPDAFNVL